MVYQMILFPLLLMQMVHGSTMPYSEYTTKRLLWINYYVLLLFLLSLPFPLSFSFVFPPRCHQRFFLLRQRLLLLELTWRPHNTHCGPESAVTSQWWNKCEHGIDRRDTIGSEEGIHDVLANRSADGVACCPACTGWKLYVSFVAQQLRLLCKRRWDSGWTTKTPRSSSTPSRTSYNVGLLT